MNKIAWIVCLLLLIPALALADDKPPVFTGIIKQVTTDRLQTIGQHGVLVIRSQARLDAIAKLMPELKWDTPLPKIDFDKQAAVMVYTVSGHGKDTFTLDKSDPAANPPELAILYTWYNGLVSAAEEASLKFIVAIIPAAPAVKVTVLSQPIFEDKPHVTTELSSIIGGKDGGDIVDGLHASITPKATTIKPGEDILIDFVLHLADPGDAKPEQFGTMPKSIVADGFPKYGLLATTPDGKTALLKLKPDKMLYRLTPSYWEITTEKPLHLWSGKSYAGVLSLKEVGLDTSAKGTYTITGLYEERGLELSPDARPDIPREPQRIWGGSITTNTITVEVKP